MAVRVTKEDFDEKVKKSSLPVVVDFYSDSCVACKKLSPVLGELEDNYEGKLAVYKVNTNFDPELAESFEIMSNPTTIIFKDGQEADRKVGAASYKEIEGWVSQYL